MTDSLTTIERNYIEHWQRRRLAMFRSWLLTGAILWGGMMSVFFVWGAYSSGKLSAGAATATVAAALAGGTVFGVAMWGIGELRYRRLRAKTHASAT